MSAKDINNLLDLSRKDIRQFSKGLKDEEAKLLVKNYYIYQDTRMRLNHQIRSLSQEPSRILSLTASVFAESESLTKKSLSDYTDNHPMGSWMKQIYGIGPVISAGILANIDITKCPTAGNLWSYCGLDPHRPTNIPKDKLKANPPAITPGNEIKFEKQFESNKRYYNSDMKRLAWLIGQSFMKFSARKECLYGHHYLERKRYEVRKNENGDYASYAQLQLQWRDYGDNVTRSILESGKLSPAHLDARARRHTVKLFLSHLQHVWYKLHYGKEPPLPFALSHLSHAHFILPSDMIFEKDDSNSLDNVEGVED